MKTRFCPDCGEQCGPDDELCPECRFPMKMVVLQQGDSVSIRKTEMDDWNRIVQILRRNGVKVETREPSGWPTHQAWWMLPGVGVFIFLITLVFGGRLADAIWDPPVAATPVLDLNRPIPEEGDTPTDTPANANPPAEGAGTVAAGGDVDTSFLKNALKTSDEQLVVPENENPDLDQFINRGEVSIDEIRQLAAMATLEVAVNDRVRKGSLLSGYFFLSDNEHLLDAFQNQTRTVTTDGSLVQETVYVVPRAGRPGTEPENADLILESEAVGVSLMEGARDYGGDYPLEFDRDLNIGDELWICNFVGDRFYPEKVRIVNSFKNRFDTNFWVIEGDFGPGLSGSPVFDVHGHMTGVFLRKAGQNLILSLYWLRDKAPLIYKEIR